MAVVGLVAVVWISAARNEEEIHNREVIASIQAETEATQAEDPETLRRQKAEEQAKFEEYVLSIEPTFEFAHFTGEPTLTSTGDATLDKAYTLAAGYDYDAAI